MPTYDLTWKRAQKDAWVLAEADEIRNDAIRLIRAQHAARKMAVEQQEKTEGEVKKIGTTKRYIKKEQPQAV